MAAAAFRLATLGLLFASCTSVATTRASLDGTNWRVTSVDGQPTPAEGDYSVQFAKGNIGARFGCNLIGGRYTAIDATLRTFDIHSTLMGCPEPAATFEHKGSLVITAPMRVEWSGEGGLTLSNSNGSIVLERAP